MFDSTAPNRLDMVWFCFDSSHYDQAPQELAETNTECALGCVQLQLELPKDIEYLTEVGQVVL